MKEKRNWESPEEKDIYYEKRKKRTKWMIFIGIIIIIVAIGAFIWGLMTLLDNSKKALLGVWSCDNGNTVLEIDENQLRLSGPNLTKGISGNYRVMSYSYTSSETSREDWVFKIKNKEKRKNGSHISFSMNSKYPGYLFVEVESTEDELICEKR